MSDGEYNFRPNSENFGIYSSLNWLYCIFKKDNSKRIEQAVGANKKEIKENNLSNIKTNLINFMELADKRALSLEQKLICYELYDDYCQHGGNSYVHDHWEKLKKEGKI